MFGRLKKLIYDYAVRILIILLCSLILAVVVNSFHPANLPLILAKGQRPGIPKGDWKEKLLYIELSDVIDQITAGDAVLIDIRESEDFDESHAVGAINLPYYEFEMALYDFEGKVSVEQELVIFGQGKLFSMSAHIASRLIALGYTDVKILKQDFEDWKRSNLPIYIETPKGSSHDTEK